MPRSKKETLVKDEINNEEIKVASKSSKVAKASTAKKTTSKRASSTSSKKSTTTKASSTSARKSTVKSTVKSTAEKSSSSSLKKSTADTKVSPSKTVSATKKATTKSKSRGLYGALSEFGKSLTSGRKTRGTRKSKKDEIVQVEEPVEEFFNLKSIITKNTKKDELESTITYDNIVEYYDLPYKYNYTTVKVLAQNPNTLFVYWEISDEDSENFKEQFGDNFFNETSPILLVHNLSDDYTFEVEVDDFANNWYIHVDDSKCKYSVELCRKVKNNVWGNSRYSPSNVINISSSNTIEIPNDRILFFDENQDIYFKNIKTGEITVRKYNSSIFGNKVKNIYHNYNLSEKENRFDFRNPSSQNPTSHGI